MASSVTITTSNPQCSDQLFQEVLAIDDDATSLYADHGCRIELPESHPFIRDEQRRWRDAAEAGRLLLARDEVGVLHGFAALDPLGDAPYLDQLSVRRASMRRGIGGALVRASATWARARGGDELWLTTYAHLPFNRLYYERFGFEVVPDAGCPLGVRHHLEAQRDCLPAPEQRVAMRLRLAPPSLA